VNGKRLYAAVAACALIVYLGALWNGFAFDDVPVVARNPLVHHLDGVWRAFTVPYWPITLISSLYRPLPLVTFTLDGLVGWAAWFHAVNLAWHAGASVAVAALARRWSGNRAALLAGVLFAVHPVHVEAVAMIVGRSDLMAALFALVAVYLAVERQSVGWSALAMVAGVLSKENAAVAPGLVVWAWVTGLAPLPPRRKLAAFGVCWIVLAIAYAAARWAVLHRYAGYTTNAPVFMGQTPLTIRLTALAALADVARLLVFPLALRADYSPLERTAVTSVLDPRALLGLLIVAGWGLLLALAWRRGRKVEAFGLGWIAIAYAPVANLLFPIGVLIAERTLYLPSVGLALAVGASLRTLPRRAWVAATALVFVAGGVRTALRVPVWRDSGSATLALLEDAPLSFQGWTYLGWEYLEARKPARALAAFKRAGTLYRGDLRVFLGAADAAYTLGQPRVADSLLALADRACYRCADVYPYQAAAARQRGDTASAAALEAHAARLRALPLGH